MGVGTPVCFCIINEACPVVVMVSLKTVEYVLPQCVEVSLYACVLVAISVESVLVASEEALCSDGRAEVSVYFVVGLRYMVVGGTEDVSLNGIKKGVECGVVSVF